MAVELQTVIDDYKANVGASIEAYKAHLIRQKLIDLYNLNHSEYWRIMGMARGSAKTWYGRCPYCGRPYKEGE